MIDWVGESCEVDSVRGISIGSSGRVSNPAQIAGAKRGSVRENSI